MKKLARKTGNRLQRLQEQDLALVRGGENGVLHMQLTGGATPDENGVIHMQGIIAPLDNGVIHME